MDGHYAHHALTNLYSLLFPSRYLLDNRAVSTVRALKEASSAARLVVCTALSASRHSLYGIRFDWCIVDEAGQINQPTVIGPLIKSHR